MQFFNHTEYIFIYSISVRKRSLSLVEVYSFLILMLLFYDDIVDSKQRQRNWWIILHRKKSRNSFFDTDVRPIDTRSACTAVFVRTSSLISCLSFFLFLYWEGDEANCYCCSLSLSLLFAILTTVTFISRLLVLCFSIFSYSLTSTTDGYPTDDMLFPPYCG